MEERVGDQDESDCDDCGLRAVLLLEQEVRRLEEKLSWHERQSDFPESPKLDEEQSLGLPVPRLEIRWIRQSDVTATAHYGLVYRHLCDNLVWSSIGTTRVSGPENKDQDLTNAPYRDGSHILNEMLTLCLPAYVVDADRRVWKAVEFPDGWKRHRREQLAKFV